MIATVTRLAPRTCKPAARRSPRAIRQARNQALTGTAIGVVALSLTGLSLCHLSHGIELVTHSASWESWAMAVGIDCGFVSLELAQVTAATDKVRKAITRFTRPAIVGTLCASAILNAFAFGAAATGWMIAPAIGLGLAIPAIIYALTRTGTAMYLEH